MRILQSMALGFLICMLTACVSTSSPATPEAIVYGVPQTQWLKLTAEQQDAVIQGYAASRVNDNFLCNSSSFPRKNKANFKNPSKAKIRHKRRINH